MASKGLSLQQIVPAWDIGDGAIVVLAVNQCSHLYKAARALVDLMESGDGIGIFDNGKFRKSGKFKEFLENLRVALEGDLIKDE